MSKKEQFSRQRVEKSQINSIYVFDIDKNVGIQSFDIYLSCSVELVHGDDIPLRCSLNRIFPSWRSL